VVKADLRTELDWLIRNRRLQEPRGWRADRPYEWTYRELFIALMRLCGADKWPDYNQALECAIRDPKTAKEHWEVEARMCLAICGEQQKY
jgi:hypothetical protein